MLTTCSVIAPLAVATGIPEDASYEATFRERTKTGTRAAPITPARNDYACSLDEQGIDVGRPMRPHLSRQDGILYKNDILARTGDEVLLNLSVAKRQQKVAPYSKTRVTGGGGLVCRKNGIV